MNRRILAAASAAVILTASPAVAHDGHARVTYPQYHHTHAGMYRDRVQRLYGTTGRYRGMYADGRHVHITKTYPTDARNTLVQITYVGALSQHPHEGPLRVESKQLVSR